MRLSWLEVLNYGLQRSPGGEKKKEKKKTLSLLSSLKLAAMSAGQINDLAHA